MSRGQWWMYADLEQRDLAIEQAREDAEARAQEWEYERDEALGIHDQEHLADLGFYPDAEEVSP